MADCWVVAKVEAGVGLRVDCTAVKMAVERTVGLAVSWIHWMAAWEADCFADGMVLT